MARKRFSEREVIETLIRTGHEIRCFRTKEIITLETVRRLEREHPVPLALGGADSPVNAAYSLREAHSKQTNGTKATSYGSDKHAIAKVRRILNPRQSKHPMVNSGRKIPSRPFPKRSERSERERLLPTTPHDR
jgi:hypothetical protein